MFGGYDDSKGVRLNGDRECCAITVYRDCDTANKDGLGKNNFFITCRDNVHVNVAQAYEIK